MSLLREASRLFARRTDEELAALLARQAFLVHRFTPDEPRYPIEEVLQQAARSSRWSRTLIGHERFVTSVAFSSLDGAIASGSADFTVRVWNPRDPDPTPVTFKGHTNTVNTVAFSPTDWRIASGGQDGTVRLWNRRELDAPPVVVKNDLRDPVSSVSFSPDGARLAIGTNEGAWIADLRKPGSPPLRLGGLYPPPGPDLPFASIAFSPDGEHVAGGTTRGDLRVYDLRAESYRLFRGHTGAVTAVAFSPDGKRLASAGLSPDWNIRLWDPADNTIPPVVVPGQESQANALAFSKDGKLVSAGKDGGLRFWSLSQSGMKPQYVQAHDGSANSVAFSPDGERVATAGLSHVVISNLRDDGMPLRFPRVHRDRVNALAFSPDNAYLVSGSEDRTARVWNLRNPSATPASLPHPEAVLPIVFSFSADGARLATATFGSVRLWNLRDPGSQPSLFWNESIPTLASLPDAAALASMTNGSGVALASRNQRGPVLSLVLSEPPAVKQWDLLSAVSQQVRSHLAAFSDDLKLIASPQTDNAIRVQDLSRPNVPPVRLAGHKGEVTALAFSHNGALLASVGRDRAVRVWDLKKPDTPLYVFQGSGNFVGFSPDDTRLLAGGMDAPDVRLWDLRASSSPPLVFNGGKAAILSAALSRDGTYLALGDADGDVWLHRLWSGAADYLCTRISRNLSLQEWRSYVGESIPYERTCPGLPPGAGATAVKP
jgi:WD40 repeat protein